MAELNSRFGRDALPILLDLSPHFGKGSIKVRPKAFRVTNKRLARINAIKGHFGCNRRQSLIEADSCRTSA